MDLNIEYFWKIKNYVDSLTRPTPHCLIDFMDLVYVVKDETFTISGV